MLPQSQLADGDAPPQQVTHVARCEMLAVRYGDDAGVAHSVVLFKVGNQLYFPPNAEEWSRALRPVAPYLFKGVMEKLQAQDAEIPQRDEVDVAADLVSSDAPAE